MAKQFLLPYSGEIPEYVNKLQSLGVLIVRPTPKPVSSTTGFKWVEGEPTLEQDGFYRQTWVQIPYVEPTITEDTNVRIFNAITKLSRAEKLFLLKILQEIINDGN